MAKDFEQAQIQAVHARNAAHDPTGHIADSHNRNRQPPPDVFERRATREHARQVFDRAVSHGFYPGGGWEPPDNPYGKPVGGSDAAGNSPPKKRR